MRHCLRRPAPSMQPQQPCESSDPPDWSGKQPFCGLVVKPSSARNYKEYLEATAERKKGSSGAGDV